MKIQKQATGARSWYGDDLLSLQEEPMRAMDGFCSQYGNFIISGCEVTPAGSVYNITPGMVSLNGKDAGGNATHKVVPFDGANNISLPVYLVLDCETETGIYHDNEVRPIVHNYTAAMTPYTPEGTDYILISASQNAPRFSDLVGTVEVSSIYDYIVDSDKALAALNGNTTAQRVLIKSGTWNATESIVLMPNVKLISGQPGAKIVSRPGGRGVQGSGVPVFALGRWMQLSRRDYDIEIRNLEVSVEAVEEEVTYSAFWGLGNIRNCSAFVNTLEEGDVYSPVYVYHSCDKLTGCKSHFRVNYMPSGTRNVYSAGFYDCTDLCLCDSLMEVDAYPSDSYLSGYEKCNTVSASKFLLVSGTCGFPLLYGMNNCYNLNNCYAEILPSVYASAFYICYNLQCCKVGIEGTVSGSTNPFYKCRFIHACCSTDNNYNECHNLLNCSSYRDGSLNGNYLNCYAVTRCLGGTYSYSSPLPYNGVTSGSCNSTYDGGYNFDYYLV